MTYISLFPGTFNQDKSIIGETHTHKKVTTITRNKHTTPYAHSTYIAPNTLIDTAYNTHFFNYLVASERTFIHTTISKLSCRKMPLVVVNWKEGGQLESNGIQGLLITTLCIAMMEVNIHLVDSSEHILSQLMSNVGDEAIKSRSMEMRHVSVYWWYEELAEMCHQCHDTRRQAQRIWDRKTWEVMK